MKFNGNGSERGASTIPEVFIPSLQFPCPKVGEKIDFSGIRLAYRVASEDYGMLYKSTNEWYY